MADQVCNVFISHIHEDDHRLQPLKDMLARHGCEARDSSINSTNPNNAKDPDYIKREILGPGIQWAGTLVVLITPDTKDSEWVKWEIEYAEKLGKRIVGVWDRGETGCELPQVLDDYHDAVVPWLGEQVVDAIFGQINGMHGPAGETAPPREMAHVTCR